MLKFNITKIRIAILGVVLNTIIFSAAAANNGVVNVYNWSDYIDESILSDFTKETGIKIVYDVFDSNDILETKLLSGKTGYDVVVPSDTFLSRQIKAGIFTQLDFEKLPNNKNMWDVIRKHLANLDPGNKHSVNYMWGTTGIGYNIDKIKAIYPDAPTDSWELIFNPEILSKFAKCGIHVVDATDEIFPLAMNYLGLDPASTEKKSLKKAIPLLKGIRPHIQKFHSSEYINALANGDICIAIGWSGDILQAMDRATEAGNGVNIAYSIPKEGAHMWFDQLAIPKDAPNIDNAYTFINYLIRPEVIAKASNYVFYANGNLASQKFIDKEILEDPAIYPNQVTMDKLFTTVPYPIKTQKFVTRAWTNIKSGR